MSRTVLMILAGLSLFICGGCAGNLKESSAMPGHPEQASDLEIPINPPSPAAIEAQQNLPRRTSEVYL